MIPLIIPARPSDFRLAAWLFLMGAPVEIQAVVWDIYDRWETRECSPGERAFLVRLVDAVTVRE